MLGGFSLCKKITESVKKVLTIHGIRGILISESRNGGDNVSKKKKKHKKKKPTINLKNLLLQGLTDLIIGLILLLIQYIVNKY